MQDADVRTGAGIRSDRPAGRAVGANGSGSPSANCEPLSGVDQSVISRLENGPGCEAFGAVAWRGLVDALGGIGDADPAASLGDSVHATVRRRPAIAIGQPAPEPARRPRSSSGATGHARVEQVTDQAEGEGRPVPAPGAGEVPDGRQPDVDEAGRRPARHRIDAGSLQAPTSGWASAAVALTSGWMASARPVRQAEVGGHERVAAVDGRRRPASRRVAASAGGWPARPRGSAKCSSVKLDSTTSNDAVGEGRSVGAQVHDRELVEVGERSARLVDVGADESRDPGPEGAQGRDPAAAGVEGRHGTRRAGLGRRDGAIERLVDEASDARVDPQPGSRANRPGSATLTRRWRSRPR